MRRTSWLAIVIVLIAAGVLILKGRHRRPMIVTQLPPKLPDTRPASRPAPPKRPTFASYMDAVRSANPAVATTQTLGVPVELPDAAHVVIRDPLFVDHQSGVLWITRPDGHPIADLLAHPPEDADRSTSSASGPFSPTGGPTTPNCPAVWSSPRRTALT